MSIGNLEYLFGSRAEMLRTALREGTVRDTRLLAELVGGHHDGRVRLVASLADTERGLGSGLLARIELWRAALRDPVYTADAAAAADAWRAALGAFVPTSMLTATVVLCGALPPGTVDLPNEAPASVPIGARQGDRD